MASAHPRPSCDIGILIPKTKNLNFDITSNERNICTNSHLNWKAFSTISLYNLILLLTLFSNKHKFNKSSVNKIIFNMKFLVLVFFTL